MNSSPRVSVVVLDWNGGATTLACLESILSSEEITPQVILVDNASRESVIDDARRRVPGLQVHRNGVNLGYSGGNNVGLQAALDAGADYVLVLNNDAELRPSSLREMVAVATSDDRIAAVGARILRRDRPSHLWMAWGEVTYRQSLVALVGQGKRNGPSYDEQRDVARVSGCALLMSRLAIERVGAFDEQYFAYHEEVDWCTRARERGFRVVYAPDAVVEHGGEGSSGGGAYVSRKQYFAARNAVHFVRRHGSLWQKIHFGVFLVGSLPLQFVRRLFSGEQGGVLLKIRGVGDALRGREIPREDLGLD